MRANEKKTSGTGIFDIFIAGAAPAAVAEDEEDAVLVGRCGGAVALRTVKAYRVCLS